MAIEETTWMGKLPEAWDTCPLKYAFSIEKRIAGREGYTVLSITQSGIKPKNMSVQGQFAQDYSKYQLVHPGDFAMNHMDLLTGWVDISKHEGVTSPDYRVFTNRNPAKFVSEFYKYLFQYCYSARVFYGMGQGVSGVGRWRLPAEMFLNFKLPVPNAEEQKAIVAYLDQQIADVDSIITEAKASIEEYKAWKASIIYEAVTKGLDPNVEMKDSGVEWIGEIPYNWAIIKTARAINFTQNGLTRRDLVASKGQIVLKLKNISADGVLDYSTTNRIELSENELATYVLQDGDFLFVRVNGSRNLVGKCAIFSDIGEPAAYNDHIIRVRLNEIIEKEYLFWYLLSDAGKREIELHTSTAAGQFTISGSGLRDIYVTLPPITEQQQICKYLIAKTSPIDRIIEEKDALISDLEAYKKSLIFEVVTGKRRVC